MMSLQFIWPLFYSLDPVHVGLPPPKQHLVSPSCNTVKYSNKIFKESEDSVSSQTEQNGNINSDTVSVQKDERQSFSLTERQVRQTKDANMILFVCLVSKWHWGWTDSTYWCHWDKWSRDYQHQQWAEWTTWGRWTFYVISCLTIYLTKERESH